MNCAQVSGTIMFQPSEAIQGNGIRFILKARYPVKGDLSAGSLYLPCVVFDVTPIQRNILLGKNYRDYRVEISGRLIRTEHEDEMGQNIVDIEIIASPNGLLLSRRRR